MQEDRPTTEHPRVNWLLQRAQELDEEAWRPPLLGKLAARRLKAMRQAKVEFDAQKPPRAAG